MAAVTGFTPSKHSHFYWSPESGDFPAENLARLDVRSPDRLVGKLYFLDDTITLMPEEPLGASAEVLGRSRHGTSYRATLENGMFLTVKWLREGVDLTDWVRLRVSEGCGSDCFDTALMQEVGNPAAEKGMKEVH